MNPDAVARHSGTKATTDLMVIRASRNSTTLRRESKWGSRDAAPRHQKVQNQSGGTGKPFVNCGYPMFLCSSHVPPVIRFGLVHICFPSLLFTIQRTGETNQDRERPLLVVLPRFVCALSSSGSTNGQHGGCRKQTVGDFQGERACPYFVQIQPTANAFLAHSAPTDQRLRRSAGD